MLSRHLGWFRSLAAGLLLLTLTASALRSADLETRGATKAANIAFKLDLKQLLESNLVKKYALDDIKTLTSTDKAQEVFKATGLDPLKDITSINAFVSGTTKAEFVISIRGKFDADKINAALAKHAEADGKIKSTKKGTLTFWEMGDEGKGIRAVVDSPGSILASNSKEALIKAIETQPKLGSLDPELVAAVKQIPAKNSMWFAAVITDEVKNMLVNVPEQFSFAKKIKFVTGNLNVTDDATFGVQISTTEADAAKDMKNAIEQMTQFAGAMAGNDEKAGPVVKEIINQLKITQADTMVTIKLVLNEALIKKIAALKP